MCRPNARKPTSRSKLIHSPCTQNAALVFPQDDGDEYLSLCLRARPGHATEIRQVFATSSSGPTFAVIDAIGGGVELTQLRATLRVESGREILAALLAPTTSQSEALKGQEGWVQANDERRAIILNIEAQWAELYKLIQTALQQNAMQGEALFKRYLPMLDKHYPDKVVTQYADLISKLLATKS